MDPTYRRGQLCTTTSPGASLAYLAINRGPGCWRLHAHGFLLAAKESSERAIATGNYDTAAYAIVYLLRHGVELYLKHLAEVTDVCLSFRDPEHARIAARGHDLKRLWANLKPFIETARFMGESETWQPLKVSDFEALVEDLHSIDPDGQTIRYPTNSKGSTNLTSIDYLDVNQVRRAIALASDTLDAWNDAYHQFMAAYDIPEIPSEVLKAHGINHVPRVPRPPDR